MILPLPMIPDISGLICDHHISGHLKVAPEHIAPKVTKIMNKPGREVFDRFCARFETLQQGKKKRQYLLPYFMSGHPGCTIPDMVELADLYPRPSPVYRAGAGLYPDTDECLELHVLYRSQSFYP